MPTMTSIMLKIDYHANNRRRHSPEDTMRFVRAQTPHGPRIGVLRADGVVDLAAEESRLEEHFGDDGERLARLGEAIRANPAAEQHVDDLVLIKPVEPVAMRDFMIFEEHVLPAWRSMGMSRGPDVWYEQPIGYFSNAATIRGPRDPIEIPGGCINLDYELEVAAVMGRPARSLPSGPPDTSPVSPCSATGPRAICSSARWTESSARSRARTSAPRSGRSS
jgi:hypothetical protein